METHCSLIEQEERDDNPFRCARETEVKEKIEKTEWQGQSDSRRGEEKRSGRFVGASETSKELAEWRRLQRKNLTNWAY